MEIYIGLGGNIGDPVANMTRALRLLDAEPGISVLAVSRLFRTPPWGKLDQPEFRNACALLRCDRSPEALLELVLDVERRLKRVRTERWGPRTVDIDLLAAENVSLASERLTLPHPRIQQRGFVLLPLADIAPDLPLAGKTVREWLKTADTTGIEPVSRDGGWWGE